jgi:hypothetical protein
MRRWNFIIGAVLIVIGAFTVLQLLLNALGIAFRIWWIFWPVVLIGLGIWILRGFRWGRGREVEREDASVPLDGATGASVRVRHGAGRLFIGAGTDTGLLLSGSFGGGLEAVTSRSAGRLAVDMRIKDRDVANYFHTWTRGRYGMLDWDFRLAQGIPLELELETGANESRLTLTELELTALRLKTGASSTQIDLPARTAHTAVSVDCGAASVRIRVPAGVAALIRVNAALAGVHVDTTRFPRSGDVYRSPDWDSAACKAEIRVDTGVGSIEVR